MGVRAVLGCRCVGSMSEDHLMTNVMSHPGRAVNASCAVVHNWACRLLRASHRVLRVGIWRRTFFQTFVFGAKFAAACPRLQSQYLRVNHALPFYPRPRGLIDCRLGGRQDGRPRRCHRHRPRHHLQVRLPARALLVRPLPACAARKDIERNWCPLLPGPDRCLVLGCAVASA